MKICSQCLIIVMCRTHSAITASDAKNSLVNGLFLTVIIVVKELQTMFTDVL